MAEGDIQRTTAIETVNPSPEDRREEMLRRTYMQYLMLPIIFLTVALSAGFAFPVTIHPSFS